MQVSIFEFLANGTGSLSRTGSLEVDGFDKLGDTAEIVFGKGFTRQSFDVDRDGRVGFLFWPVSECAGRSYLEHLGAFTEEENMIASSSAKLTV